MRAVVAAQMLDLVTFTVAILVIGIPIEAEVNPLLARAFVVGGIVLVAAYKLASLVAILALASRVRTRSRRGPVLLGWALGLLGAFGNLGTIAGIG